MVGTDQRRSKQRRNLLKKKHNINFAEEEKHCLLCSHYFSSCLFQADLSTVPSGHFFCSSGISRSLFSKILSAFPPGSSLTLIPFKSQSAA